MTTQKRIMMLLFSILLVATARLHAQEQVSAPPVTDAVTGLLDQLTMSMYSPDQPEITYLDYLALIGSDALQVGASD